MTVWGDEGAIDGWVPMSELYLVYDYISFEESMGANSGTTAENLRISPGIPGSSSVGRTPMRRSPALG